MERSNKLCKDYEQIEKAINFVTLNLSKQPKLNEIASHVGMSDYHFQRVFTQWVGLSPKKFMQYLTLESIKKRMDSSKSLLTTSIENELSSTSRLHDIFVKFEGITPGEYNRHNKGMIIYYEFYSSPFGKYIIGVTEKGICHLSFIQPDSEKTSIDKLHKLWPQSKLVRNIDQTIEFSREIFSGLDSLKLIRGSVYLKGSPFQIKVWEALLRIPPGKIVSYKGLSLMLGMPKSTRAVANAIAKNPIGFIIPCHRVIRSTGQLGGYRWGIERKAALLGWEATHSKLEM